jgi:hypothetical protein
MRDRSEDARQEDPGEYGHQQPVSRTVCALGLGARKPSNPMAQQGSRARPQEVRASWKGQLCQCGDQIGAPRAGNDRVVTGKLSEYRKAEARQPNERVKPQPAEGKFVQESDQVVTPPRMCDLVNQHRVELCLTQQPVYSLRKRDMRVEHTAHGGSLAHGG